MLYIKSIKPSANTSKESPKVEKIKVFKGVIHSIDVFIPAGHKGLAKLQLFHGGHIIMPTNEDGFVSGNKGWIRGRFFYDLKRQNNVLTLKAWNADDTEAHEFIVHIGILPKEVLLPIFISSGFVESLKSLFIREPEERE